MADYGKSIYLGGTPSEPFDLDVREMLPGRIAVCMDQAETRNGIYMPSSGRLTPDSGVVIYSGVPEVPEGDRVLTRAYDGHTLTGKWLTRDGVTIKLYGVADDWYNDVVALWRRKLGGEQIIPLWDHVLIERSAVVSSLAMADTSAYGEHWTDIARVVYLADRAANEYRTVNGKTVTVPTGLTARSKVIYKGDCLDFRLGNVPENMGLIRYSQIQAVIE